MSTLIEAIEGWFISQGRDEEQMLTATTGSAASHISAVTLHSATEIMIEDCDSPKTREPGPFDVFRAHHDV